MEFMRVSASRAQPLSRGLPQCGRERRETRDRRQRAPKLSSFAILP
jgi:hypothetical protein